jgi:hypothetical protein
MTRLAEGAPPWCASCYQQNLEQRHVDFDAAYDGPVLEGVDAAVKPQIDDLVVCESCLAEAARLLGWETVDTSRERERDRLTIQRVEAEKTAIVEYARKLEETISKGRESGRVPQAKGRPIKKPGVLV